MAERMDQFAQAGWWIPGSLLPGWSSTFQANFNDLGAKLAQLRLTPIVAGPPPDPDIGFYFSEAEYDFIQLLTLEPVHPGPPERVLPATNVVAYSIWMASQGWAHFSPIPILTMRQEPPPPPLSPAALSREASYPAGWYLPGKLSASWYEKIDENYALAEKARADLKIEDLSPFYLTQSTLYDCVQMVTIRPENAQETSIMAYLAWFNGAGFGSLSAVPFLAPDLVSAAINLAGMTP